MEPQNNKLMVAGAQQTAIAMRREMVKIPAVMNALGPIEKAVFLASTAKTIAEYQTAELATELNAALKWIAQDIGYRSTGDSDKQYLVIRTGEILKRYYPELTLRDFRMAFEMSITGALDEFLPKGRNGQPERNHYQQFNAEYICRILNAYRGRRGEILKRAYDNMPQTLPAHDPNKDVYYRNQTRKGCINAYLFYKYHNRLPQMLTITEMLYYDELAAVGLAHEIRVTNEERNRIFQQTVNELSKQHRFQDLQRLKHQGKDAPELNHGLFALARRRALKRTFEWMVKHETQITDYIKFEDGKQD